MLIFFFNDTATTEIYTLSLHDALPIYETGALEKAIARLRENGHVYEADGATWLRTTDFGDDKDRPLVKSDGEPTYFAADCAYYLDKRSRGFDKVVIMLGADHAGYVGQIGRAHV